MVIITVAEGAHCRKENISLLTYTLSFPGTFIGHVPYLLSVQAPAAPLVWSKNVDAGQYRCLHRVGWDDKQ